MDQTAHRELPAPLTPADCDLSGYTWMPLFGQKLLSSDFNTIAMDAEFRAAINLWWAAYMQTPGFEPCNRAKNSHLPPEWKHP